MGQRDVRYLRLWVWVGWAVAFGWILLFNVSTIIFLKYLDRELPSLRSLAFAASAAEAGTLCRFIVIGFWHVYCAVVVGGPTAVSFASHRVRDTCNAWPGAQVSCLVLQQSLGR